MTIGKMKTGVAYEMMKMQLEINYYIHSLDC